MHLDLLAMLNTRSGEKFYMRTLFQRNVVIREAQFSLTNKKKEQRCHTYGSLCLRDPNKSNGSNFPMAMV